MAFRFKLNEPLARGVRRVAFQQIDRAAGHIQAMAGDDAVTSVHEARKCLKRGRALLRFVKPLLVREDYKTTNGILRDVGKSLSGTRDRDVMRVTVTKLVADKALKAATAKRLTALLDSAEPVSAAPGSDGPTAEQPAPADLVGRLVELKASIEDLSIDADGHRLPTAGLAESMAELRKGFTQAYESRDGEAFHEWRKTVQLHWRHMQLVVNAWPELCRARIEEARAISQLIGDDRDLALLLAHIGQHPLPKAMQAEVAELVGVRQAALRLEARARGDRLLCEGTSGFCRRLEAYWTASRSLRAIQPPEKEA